MKSKQSRSPESKFGGDLNEALLVNSLWLNSFNISTLEEKTYRQKQIYSILEEQIVIFDSRLSFAIESNGWNFMPSVDIIEDYKDENCLAAADQCRAYKCGLEWSVLYASLVSAFNLCNFLCSELCLYNYFTALLIDTVLFAFVAL